MQANKVVDINGVSKSYGQVLAVDHVSLHVYRGENIGILGPNGAGKTTLIEIVEGLRTLDSGSVTVLGVDLSQRNGSLRRRMGICMQKTALPPVLSVSELLRLYSVIFENSASWTEMLALFGLEDKRSALVKTLSGGQLQRLAVALALMGNPEVLFLDEPTSELDPAGRRAIWDALIERRVNKGQTTILTTHQMEEAQKLCTRVAILDHGRLLDFDSPAALINRHCPGNVIRFSTNAHTDLDGLSASVEPDHTESGRVNVAIHTTCLERTMQSLMAPRPSGPISLGRLTVDGCTLEDVFLKMTGKMIRD